MLAIMYKNHPFYSYYIWCGNRNHLCVLLICQYEIVHATQDLMPVLKDCDAFQESTGVKDQSAYKWIWAKNIQQIVIS